MATQSTQPSTQEPPVSKDEFIKFKDELLKKLRRDTMRHAWLAFAIMGAGWVGAGVAVGSTTTAGGSLTGLGFLVLIMGAFNIWSINKNFTRADHK